MPRLSKKAKQEWDFFINLEQADEHTTAFVLNAKTNASRATRQSLFFVRNTNPKEGQKALKIAVNMTTAVNLI